MSLDWIFLAVSLASVGAVAWVLGVHVGEERGRKGIDQWWRDRYEALQKRLLASQQDCERLRKERGR